jgi:hypothetical protein
MWGMYNGPVSLISRERMLLTFSSDHVSRTVASIDCTEEIGYSTGSGAALNFRQQFVSVNEIWGPSMSEKNGKVREGIAASQKGDFRQNMSLVCCTVCSVYKCLELSTSEDVFLQFLLPGLNSALACQSRIDGGRFG